MGVSVSFPADGGKFPPDGGKPSFFEISFLPDPSTSRSFETNSTLPGALFVSEQQSFVV